MKSHDHGPAYQFHRVTTEQVNEIEALPDEKRREVLSAKLGVGTVDMLASAGELVGVIENSDGTIRFVKLGDDFGTTMRPERHTDMVKSFTAHQADRAAVKTSVAVGSEEVGPSEDTGVEAITREAKSLAGLNSSSLEVSEVAATEGTESPPRTRTDAPLSIEDVLGGPERSDVEEAPVESGRVAGVLETEQASSGVKRAPKTSKLDLAKLNDEEEGAERVQPSVQETEAKTQDLSGTLAYFQATIEQLPVNAQTTTLKGNLADLAGTFQRSLQSNDPAIVRLAMDFLESFKGAINRVKDGGIEALLERFMASQAVVDELKEEKPDTKSISFGLEAAIRTKLMEYDNARSRATAVCDVLGDLLEQRQRHGKDGPNPDDILAKIRALEPATDAPRSLVDEIKTLIEAARTGLNK